MTSSIARLVSRGWTRNVFFAAALIALAQPLLTPFSSDLAGWNPGHGHVYVDGQVVPHAHPWDRSSSEPGHGSSDTALHICEVHLDGIVLAGSPLVAAPLAASDGARDEIAIEPSSDGVTFLFDLNLTGSILLAPDAPLLGCSGALVATDVAVPLAPATVSTVPTVPPPRA